MKLARELSKRQTGRTLYLLDEPTTGLHFDDVRKLLEVLHRLTDLGNTVIIIEHNLDIIRNADYLLDLGPEGGEGGGRIIAHGTPEQVATVAGSHTGSFLARHYTAHAPNFAQPQRRQPRRPPAPQHRALPPPTATKTPAASSSPPEKKTGVPTPAPSGLPKTAPKPQTRSHQSRKKAATKKAAPKDSPHRKRSRPSEAGDITKIMPRRPTSPLPASQTDDALPPPPTRRSERGTCAAPLPSNPAAMTAAEEPAIPVIRPILPDGEAILQPPMDNTPNDAPPEPPPASPTSATLCSSSPSSPSSSCSHPASRPRLSTPSHAIGSELPPRSIHPQARSAPRPSPTSPPSPSPGSSFLCSGSDPSPTASSGTPPPPAATPSASSPSASSSPSPSRPSPRSSPCPSPSPWTTSSAPRSDVWLVTVFGTLLAPLFEEIAFRGFLLPAFAIAYDWLSLPRTPAAREHWNTTNQLTFPALVFSAILTSILFALLHGQQIAYAWPVLLLLFCVSLILTVVRIRLRSVLASTLVHASYNFSIFLTAFIATGGYRHLEKMSR